MLRISLDGPWQYSLGDGGAPGTMTLPANWHLAGLPDYAGAVQFSRTFEAPALPPGGRAWLRFEGVDYFAEVELNGKPVGGHEGYFQPFEFEVTGLLRPGANEITVRVDSPREDLARWPNDKYLVKGVFNHHDCRPGSWDPEHGQDGNTGGIWNSVSLVLDEGVRIHALRATPALIEGGAARVRVTARVSAAAPGPFEARLRLIGPSGGEERAVRQAAFLPAGSSELHWVFTVPEPELWWTWDHGSQPLYTLELELAAGPGSAPADRAAIEFGIRDLRIGDGWVWTLNGRRFFPRGTNVIPTQWLSEYGPSMIARDIELLRGANLNAVRVHAHVQRDEFYTALDRAGILCWQDFALQWSYDESDEFAANACRQIKDMVQHLYNHPSIVVWCCHNEPAKNRETLDPLLEQAVREIDSSRHIEAASDFRFHTYPGWYRGDLREFAGVPAAPFVNEFGAQALMNASSMRETFGEGAWPPDWRLWTRHDFQYGPTFEIAKVAMADTLEGLVENSQAYQAKLLKYAIEQYRLARFLKDRPVTGFFQFMFMDCWPSITWSVVDYYRRPKLGYDALRLACQPVLPVIRLGFGGEAVPAGGQFLFDVPVVNDTFEEFTGLHSEFTISGPGGETVHRGERLANLGPDTVSRLIRTVPWRIPPDAGAGDYRIDVTVRRPSGEILAVNHELFRVVRLPEGTYQLAVVE